MCKLGLVQEKTDSPSVGLIHTFVLSRKLVSGVSWVEFNGKSTFQEVRVPYVVMVETAA